MAETMRRNPFFLPSGFEPQEIVNTLEAKRSNKKRLNKIKERKRAEKKIMKQTKHNREIFHLNPFSLCNKCKPSKKSTKTGQIQRGFDLATKWGWDGINRPYTPKIMSVFGGNKRKKG